MGKISIVDLEVFYRVGVQLEARPTQRLLLTVDIEIPTFPPPPRAMPSPTRLIISR